MMLPRLLAVSMVLSLMVLLLMVLLHSGTAAAGQDAAQEVQEGNVRQWMEYYERERNRSGGMDSNQEAASEAKSPAGQSKRPEDDPKVPTRAVTQQPERD